MTKEEMNYHVDKAIEDFPEWPDHAVCIWVGKQGNANPSFYALDQVKTAYSTLGYSETEGNGVNESGCCFYYSVHHGYWFKVIPEMYHLRKFELSMLGSNDWYERRELPPVGTECEFLDVSKWVTGTVSFTGKSKGIFKMNNGQELLFHTNLTQYFRPIQTERHRTLGEAFALFEENMTIAEFAEALYDAGLLRDNNKENNNE